MTRIKNGAVVPTRKLQFAAQALLTDPENRTLEVVSNEGVAGKAYITVMGGEGSDTPTRKEIVLAEATQVPVILDELIPNIAAVAANLKADYTTGDLSDEAEIIAAVNATNTKANAIATALNTLTAALVTAGIMDSGV